MYPTQLAAEAIAAAIGDHPWKYLSPGRRRHYLGLAEAACKGIVAGEEGWRIVTLFDNGPGGYEIVEEWTCD